MLFLYLLSVLLISINEFGCRFNISRFAKSGGMLTSASWYKDHESPLELNSPHWRRSTKHTRTHGQASSRTWIQNTSLMT